MITHTVEVEQLLVQYDPGMILVGPLLSLSMSSSFRYFYVAGNGSRVYETISLGFVEFEASAQTQRTDFVGKLNKRFAEVLTFGSRLEMAHAVHTRWPNKETAIFLESAERELIKPTAADLHGAVHDEGRHVDVVPGDNGRRLVEEVAPESVDSAEAIDDNLAHAPPWMRDDEQPMPMLRLAQTLMPSRVPISALSQPLRRDRAVIAHRHSGLSQDDVASAILRLKSPAEVGGIPGLPVEGGRSSVSIFLRFCVAGGSLALIAALIAWGMVRTSTWQVASHAAPNRAPAAPVSVRRNKGDSQTEATVVPPSDPNYVTEANKPALQADPVPTPPSPPSEPSQMAGVPAGAAPAAQPSSLPSEPSQMAGVPAGAAPAAQPSSPPSEPSQLARVPAGAAPAAQPSSPPSEPSQMTGLPAGAAPAAQPSSPPSEPSLMAGVLTGGAPAAQPSSPPSDPSRMAGVPGGAAPAAQPSSLPSEPSQMAGVPAGAAPAAQPSSPPSESSQMASVPAGSAPVSGPQSLPVQGGSAARQLDADEIASLVNRGTDSLKSGDLASARLLLRRAAEAGSASAALMLGTTFDPLALQQLGAIGVVPDVAQARQWYEKAAALGSDSASQRLAKLGQIGH